MIFCGLLYVKNVTRIRKLARGKQSDSGDFYASLIMSELSARCAHSVQLPS